MTRDVSSVVTFVANTTNPKVTSVNGNMINIVLSSSADFDSSTNIAVLDLWDKFMFSTTDAYAAV